MKKHIFRWLLWFPALPAYADLPEMEITARLMITGGELQEDARFTRSDRALIREAILHAARLTACEKRQTLTQDIRDALFTLAQVRRYRNPAVTDCGRRAKR